MTRRRYTKSFRKRVVEEALKPEYEGKEFLVAEKYHIQTSTLVRWMDLFNNYGEMGLADNIQQFRKKESMFTRTQKQREAAKDKEIAELKEEIAILKKAAAFLAKMPRD
ncbi:transposase [Murdochiella sp. Marseille-P8839]|nr:transposase [Murdochiella sp. Marseille-P8839]